MAVTNKRRAFIENYLQSFNATEAALRAGYSEKTAYSQGSRLLKNVEIVEEINRRISETAMDADEVLLRLSEQARATPEIFLEFTEEGDYRINLDKARRLGKLHLIRSIVPTQAGVRIEMHDQQSALVQIGRALGLFHDNLNVSAEIAVVGLGFDTDKL